MATAADLEPGQSAWDNDFPLRARYVHSVKRTGKDQITVSWGHPDQDEPDDIEIVPADKEYDLIER